MGDDGDIAYRLSHRGAFPSLGSAVQAMGSGDKIRKFTAQCGTFYCISSMKNGLLRIWCAASRLESAANSRIQRGKMALLHINLPMNRPVKSWRTKPRLQRLVLVCAVAFAVLLLLLRMLNFVRGRH
jgi:preprotein translocase subunit SecG